MRKPRVLVLNHFAASRGEAGGTRHVELLSRLRAWQHLIIASDLNPQTGRRVGNSEGFLSVPVVGYSRNGASRILNWTSYGIGAIWRGMRTGPVDVVYGSSPHLLAGLAAWTLAVAKRVPFVLEVRDLWPRVLVDMGHLSKASASFKLLTALEEFLYAQADAIVVMAEGSREELVTRGVPAEKITYIPNGADPEDFLATADREALRQRYGFHRITALYAGAHGPANGLQLLLDGAAKVSTVDVVLVGGGVLKDSLVREAQERSLQNVRFLDPVAKSEIPDLLAAADIGLHILADVEIFRKAVSPNKIFDYMAAGLPVLTNCPGLVAEVVLQSGAGLAVAPTGVSDGLRAFEAMSAEDRQRMGKSGEGWLASHQSRRAMAERLEKLLNGVIGATTGLPSPS